MAIKKLDVVTQVCPFPLIEAKAALAEMGITNETQLNDAIRNMKPLNLSLMADRQQERKAS